MLRIDPKWGETASSFLQRSLGEASPQLRKRYLALHFIASGETGLQAAEKVGMNRVTVSEWVQRFNEDGLEGLVPNWKGQPGRMLSDEQLEALKEAVSHHPREIGIKKGRWTAKTVVAYVKKNFGKKIHADTARNYLHLLGFSYRKPGKKFLKADPDKQQHFARDLEELESKRTPRSVTVYVDEGKIEQDALPRKGWFLKGQPAEVDSTSPGKKNAFLRRCGASPGKSDHHAAR
jgi:transposase